MKQFSVEQCCCELSEGLDIAFYDGRVDLREEAAAWRLCDGGGAMAGGGGTAKRWPGKEVGEAGGWWL